MPAPIVLVHDDPEVAQATAAALRTAGHQVATFGETSSALTAFATAQKVEVLITRVAFPPGPGHFNGVALSHMARARRPGLKVLFTALPEQQRHTEGFGEFLPLPVAAADIVATVDRMLAKRPWAGDQISATRSR
jgi:DNA-binding NtrC family response regulator